jgi:hypothetical protein
LEPESAPEPTGFPEPRTQPAARPPRRRGRTTLIIAAAAALGVVGGTAVGYKIQADRSPTPLAALSQPGLSYPAKSLPKGVEPAPLPAGQDRQVKTSGDLRKLLLKKPSGATDSNASWIEDGWSSPGLYTDDGDYFKYVQSLGPRRIASASWDQGQRETNIDLVQFRAGTTGGAVDFAVSERRYSLIGDPVKGSGNGRYWPAKVERKPGRLPLYHAVAVVQRGDVVLNINIFDTKAISKKDIRTVTERQLERL